MLSLSVLLIAGVAVSTAALPPTLKIRGTQVVASDGRPVWLRGVNVACLEWSSDGEGHVLKTIEVAINDWKVNHIRLPLSQDRWFGKAPEQTDSGVAYRELVDRCVKLCAENKVYIMLDLHWNNAGEWGKHIGQHVMPDMFTMDFWKDCAKKYANHPAVLFDIYNEPHDTTWDIWRHGGEIDERRGVGARQGAFVPVKYRTPGMQAFVDVIRELGARNLIVIGGLDWSYDLSGVLEGKGIQDRTGNGILYACHAYPFKGDTVEVWKEKMAKYTKELPVIVSEFGAGPGRGAAPGQTGEDWVKAVLDIMRENRYHWSAWDLHPAAGPTLISDWNYTPTPGFGVHVKADLAKP
ncbi:MAG TPA: glycoside hydrolase family 5 protein [Fimbriimonadaceae bacterium]|nr:glycoside hydrolase family 5 protein [Fimbriimonadaceae bacterium]